jgi:hypothetical protein
MQGVSTEYLELEKLGLKKCTKCQEIKLHNEFYKRKKTGKYSSKCKQCLEQERRRRGVLPKEACKKYDNKKEADRAWRKSKKNRKFNFTEKQWVNGGRCICRNCGIKFIPMDKNYNTFCSRECNFKWKIKNKKSNICTICGKRYYVNEYDIHDGVCSTECYLKTITKICKYCGKEFHPKVSKTEAYCSNGCRYQQHLKWRRDKHLSNILYITKQCAWCGKEYQTYRKRQKYCSNRCSNNAKYKCYRARKRKAKHEKIDYYQVYRRDEGICYLCGQPVHKEYKKDDVLSGTIDHVIALNNGGTHTYNNVKLAHMICNSIKGDDSYIPLERSYYLQQINKRHEREGVIPC